MSEERRRLRERRDLVARDLEELAAQQEMGEVGEDTAARLAASYRSELESLEAALAELPEDEDDVVVDAVEPDVTEPDAPAARRSTRSVVIASLVIIAVLSGGILFAATRGGDEGTAAPQSPGALTVDPNDVSNEQLEGIVAANPNVTPMRMALADRYFSGEDFGPALDHYLYIAENAPEPADQAQAMARIGWMAYRTELPAEASEYVDASLLVDPTNAEAILYRGFITFYGLGDAAAAIPQLEEALELPNISGNVVDQIVEALAEARAAETP